MDNPYFLKNKSWYIEFNEPRELEGITVKYVLTESAPAKAKESYLKYYGDIFGMSSDGTIWSEDSWPY